MFQLTDIRKTAVWKEAHEEGVEKGKSLAKQELVHKLLAEGKSVNEIAALLGVPVKEVRRLAKNSSK